jgi:hypothetical protein
LPGYVDILMEMGWAGSPDDAADRRRWLRGFSRHQQTRRHVIVELSADGQDYLLRGTVEEERTALCWEVVRWVLQGVNDRVTQREILENWLEDYAQPDPGTLVRTMNAVAAGRVRVQGTGFKNDPFRYWLPEREDDFHPGPNADQKTLQRWHQRQIEKAMGVMAAKINSKLQGNSQVAVNNVAVGVPASAG